MATDQMVETPSTEFSPSELAALRERKEALSAQWVNRATEEMVLEGDTASLTAGLSAEAQEEIERISREYKVVEATLKEHEQAKERAQLDAASEDLTRNAPRYRDLQAKREAKFFEALMAVGRNEYKNPSPDAKAGIHPKSLAVHQPLIAADPNTGRNEVHPFNAIFPKEGEDRSASIEASFRHAEIIAADKFGKYDPITGNKVGNHQEPIGRQIEAELGFSVPEQVSDAYLRQGGMLYLYEIQQNELGRYVDVKQTPYINDYIVNRRTAIGTAALVNESGAISISESDFDSVTIKPRKYGMVSEMTFESSEIMEPYMVADTIMADGGNAMGRAVGGHIVTGRNQGTNMNQEWEGFITWAKAAAANRASLGARATFLQGTNTFGIDDMSTFMTSLDKEYFRAPNKLLSMSTAVWGGLNGAVDGEGRKLFDSNMSLQDMALPDYNIRVILDENWEDRSAAGNIVWFYGDFKGACLVYFGPARVDFSSELRFLNDRLAWRFIQHRGFAIIDPNAFNGGAVG